MAIVANTKPSTSLNYVGIGRFRWCKIRVMAPVFYLISVILRDAVNSPDRIMYTYTPLGSELASTVTV